MVTRMWMSRLLCTALVVMGMCLCSASPAWAGADTPPVRAGR